MKPAIRVENLSKQYRIGKRPAPGSRNLTESLTEGARGLWRALKGQERSTDDDDKFWALKDVSFEVQPGEVVGIIGRNGAGKSTLLKVLSRIVEPTSGRLVYRGRMASLLEVGTGFHPELTGRENIFLNGSLLGMKRHEIDRKFDEIVAFSEIEQFLDTPVKRYSSGMYVRLAFAVAAHLEPEILVVDEVLAVGDIQFQMKCLGKMDSVANEGRTVLMVSHQMQALQAITRKAILLDQGRIVAVGPTSAVIKEYLGNPGSSVELDRMSQSGSGEARFLRLSLRSGGEPCIGSIGQGEELQLKIDIECEEPIPSANLAIAVRNGEGVEVFSHSWSDQTDEFIDIPKGTHSITITIPTANLRLGNYWLTLYVTGHGSYGVAMLSGISLPAVVRKKNVRIDIEAHRWGVVLIPCKWEMERFTAMSKSFGAEVNA